MLAHNHSLYSTTKRIFCKEQVLFVEKMGKRCYFAFKTGDHWSPAQKRYYITPEHLIRLAFARHLPLRGRREKTADAF